MGDCIVEMGENECFSGNLVTCKSGSCDWYAQAEAEFDNWLHEHPTDLSSAGSASSCDLASSSSQDLSADLVSPLEDLVPARIVLKGRRCGHRTYLVEWQSADGLCTWEAEADLENHGHSPVIERFHATRRDTAVENKSAKGVVYTPVPRHTFNPAQYWQNFMSRIQHAFSAAGLTAKNIYNVCNERRALAFSKRMASLSSSVPVLLFHGTRTQYVRNIIDEGLRVPNTGPSPVPVRNGSRFGVGIYTATDPSVSRYYSDGLMFVCAGLVGSSFSTPEKAHDVGGGVCVFEDASLVLPCFLVRFSTEADTTPPVYHSHLMEHVLDREIRATLVAPHGDPKNEASKNMKAFQQRHSEYAGVRHTQEEQLEARACRRAARKIPREKHRCDDSSEDETPRPTADPYYRCEGPFPLNQAKKRTSKGEKSREKLARMKAHRMRY
eukprot:TRINITY_DN57888_c0_g1_i1.p1 TRINITY_DN57888_c0_g1~~TRINITY_DN57888_c0_g1_i1.p1  ORF type:complete len:461 (+),score=81.80 TRINITY_DN57888_c0_g1_i1:68-1384(+)